MGDRDLHDPYGFEKFHGETQQSRSEVPLITGCSANPAANFADPIGLGSRVALRARKP